MACLSIVWLTMACLSTGWQTMFLSESILSRDQSLHHLVVPIEVGGATLLDGLQVGEGRHLAGLYGALNDAVELNVLKGSVLKG